MGSVAGVFSQPTSGVSRREFLKSSLAFVGAAAIANQPALSAESSGAKLRGAIIGHTGRGDYGHGLDVVFNERSNIEVVAVADPNPTGRAKAADKCKALRQFEDYRVMLEKEKPQLVSIAPRWTDQHHAMGLAALQAGAHFYLEKPITQTLEEADELLALADKTGLKIAVAHQMRLAPSILHLKRVLDDGLLGDLVQIRAWGKQDSRAGGEDMLVLGTHLFDLIRFFAGDASWCSARVLQNGGDITRADARKSGEEIGPIAGDEIEAQFGFANGLQATFTSRAKLRQTIAHWGVELIGSKTTARILADIFPTVLVLDAGKWDAAGKADRWRRLENDPTLNATDAEQSVARANQRVVDDWLDAIQKRREPICSGRAAMKSLEMVMAVYQAALTGARVPLPLELRRHPLRTA